MNICGFLPQSTIDYPGHISAVIFTSPCNFACGFCHNSQFIKLAKPTMTVPEMLAAVKSRKKFLDAVVFTGGEPTLQKDLDLVIKKVKALGLKVKLDTNGYKPKVLQRLLKKKLLDYIAMDIKAPLNQYSKITNRRINTGTIRESVRLIQKYAPDYEFRTTVLPEFTSDDIQSIGFSLCYVPVYAEMGALYAKRYILQQFNPKHAKGARYRAAKSTPKGTLQNLIIMLKSRYDSTEFETRNV